MPTARLHALNADLHCHSHVSDGTLAPAEVARRAAANGVQLWALTDHDEVGGLAEAQAAATAVGLRFVPGVEVSVTWAGETVHIVGLGIDHRDPVLVAGLAATRGGRQARAREIAAQLEAAGIPGSYEGALPYVGNPELISRTHFARFLVERGYCRDVSEVFKRYLSDGKPGYVPHRWARLTDAIGWIRGAGGIAVVAHPGRYPFDDMQMWTFLTEFHDAGGEAIEVISSSHSTGQYARFEALARRFGFMGSRGSDFHGPGEGDVELGEVPPLPASLVPVWSRLV